MKFLDRWLDRPKRPAAQWISYTARVEGAPSMISVDAAWIDHRGFGGAGTLITLQIPLIAPAEDGMVRPEELPQLQKLVSALAAALPGSGAFVGTRYGDGRLHFHAYCVDAARAIRAARAVARGDRPAEAHETPDPAWAFYARALYPDATAWQDIRNAALCESLARSGDAGLAPRSIDHYAYFPDRAGAEAFAAAVTRLGYEVLRVDEDGPKPQEPFYALFTREGIPREINPATAELLPLAQSHGGRYDVWDCLIVRDPL